MFKLLLLLNFTHPTDVYIQNSECSECCIQETVSKGRLFFTDGEWVLEADGKYYPTSFPIEYPLEITYKPANFPQIPEGSLMFVRQ